MLLTSKKRILDGKNEVIKEEEYNKDDKDDKDEKDDKVE
jgi:hypothetical protein